MRSPLAASCMIFPALVIALAALPALAQPGPNTANAQPARSAEEVQKDLVATIDQSKEILSEPANVLEVAKRGETGPKLIPTLKRMVALSDELMRVAPKAKEAADLMGARSEYLM